jgi:hypothetical protein
MIGMVASGTQIEPKPFIWWTWNWPFNGVGTWSVITCARICATCYAACRCMYVYVSAQTWKVPFALPVPLRLGYNPHVPSFLTSLGRSLPNSPPLLPSCPAEARLRVEGLGGLWQHDRWTHRGPAAPLGLLVAQLRMQQDQRRCCPPTIRGVSWSLAARKRLERARSAPTSRSPIERNVRPNWCKRVAACTLQSIRLWVCSSTQLRAVLPPVQRERPSSA